MTYSRRDARPSPYAACSTNGEPRNVINQTSQSLPPFALLAVSKTLMTDTVRHQRSLDRTGGLNKGEFLAHRNVHRSEDETANPTIEGTG
jgi:hypothetical protein